LKTKSLALRKLIKTSKSLIHILAKYQFLSIYYTLKHKEPCLVSLDRDLDFVYRFKSVTFVSPYLHPFHPIEVQHRVHALWMRSLPPAVHFQCIVELGSGIGDETVFLSKATTPGCKVYALEPDPASYRCLRKTILYNNITNVIPVQACISKEDGFVPFDIESPYLSRTLIIQDTFRHPIKNTVSIQSLSMRSLLSSYNILAIDFLKCNIEGSELDVITPEILDLSVIRHAAIECHAFKYNETGNAFFQTYDRIVAFLTKYLNSVAILKYNTFFLSPREEQYMLYYRSTCNEQV